MPLREIRKNSITDHEKVLKELEDVSLFLQKERDEIGKGEGEAKEHKMEECGLDVTRKEQLAHRVQIDRTRMSIPR